MTKKKQERRSFTPDFKADVVRMCKTGDRSIGEVSRELGLTETSVWAWVQHATVDAGQGPADALTTAEKLELGPLRRDNRVLREERDILKNYSGPLTWPIYWT